MPDIPKKIALVLSGGAEKGYFKVGAFKAIAEAGFAPDRIYGTSVGSLNGSYITLAAAEIQDEFGHELTTDHWKLVAAQLEKYWTDNIRQPSDIATKRDLFLSVAPDVLGNHFKGLSDTSPINSKIDQMLTGKLPLMANGPVKLKVASVDYRSGEISHTGPGDADFLTYVKGSIAIPVMMPPSVLVAPHLVLFDGGVREVAPLNEAIKDGAQIIYAVLCQAKDMGASDTFIEGNLMQMTERSLNIVVNQNVNNDVKLIDLINDIITEANSKGITLDRLKDYKLIDHKIIRPDATLTTDIAHFTADDIKNGIQQGYETTKRVLGVIV